MVSGTSWVSEVVWLLVTGDYEGAANRKQEDRMYFLGIGVWTNLKQAAEDQHKRVFKARYLHHRFSQALVICFVLSVRYLTTGCHTEKKRGAKMAP